MHQPDEYCGPEKRRGERRFCPMDERISRLETQMRASDRRVNHIAECLEGYKPFVMALQKEKELKARVWEKVLEQGMIFVMLSIAGGIIALVWYAATHWVKDVR